MEKKNFVWNLIGSLLNAFTSLFFMIIVSKPSRFISDNGLFRALHTQNPGITKIAGK